MACGTGVPATTSTDKGKFGGGVEAGSRSRIASSGVSSHKREKGWRRCFHGGVTQAVYGEVWKVEMERLTE